jgi:purine-binding chemotaxis protein CheW
MDERGTDADLQLVTFTMDGEEYGVDVMQVKEIICLPQITPSPTPYEHVEGVINLRGSVVPVINLRKRLGLPQIDHDHNTRVAVMNFEGGDTGFIIDRVCEVMRVKKSAILPPSEGIGEKWVAGILNLEKLVIVMDLEQLGAGMSSCPP